MRNLKTAYVNAVQWSKNTGAGLRAEGKETTVKGKELNQIVLYPKYEY